MKYNKVTTVLLLSALMMFGCKRSPVKENQNFYVTDSTALAPCGELSVPASVDMGVFVGDSLKKETVFKYRNVGNDTLYISSVLPECDCTEILDFEAKLAPGEVGAVKVSLDLSGYPCDTIRKDVGILSSDRHDRVKRVTLLGLRK